MYENTYWNHKGKYPTESKELRARVPDRGRCENTRIEAYRCTANLYYDLFNNGLGNLAHCYQEEWNYLVAYESSLTHSSVGEIDPLDFTHLRLMMAEIIRIQSSWDNGEGDETSPYPADSQEVFELFEKLLNAAIKWAHGAVEEEQRKIDAVGTLISTCEEVLLRFQGLDSDLTLNMCFCEEIALLTEALEQTRRVVRGVVGGTK